MTTAIRTRIVRIGNSQGVRIPKLLLEQVNLTEDEEVELKVQSEQIVICPTYEARHGWEAAFQAMAVHQDDELLDEVVGSTTGWDEEEWEW